MKEEKINLLLSRLTDPKQRRFLYELKDKLTKNERVNNDKVKQPKK